MVSVRRVAPILLLAVAVPAFAAAKKPANSSTPPRQLHRYGDHWTAYNPPDPATYPAGAKTWTIKAGDTLWGLAKQFYNNPYLWPQLWESNTWITDAHWIYPGDVLQVDGETAAASTAGVATTAGASTSDSGALLSSTSTPAETTTGSSVAADLAAAASRPIPLGAEGDIYCYGYVGRDDEPMPNRVASWEDVELRYVPHATSQPLGGSDLDLLFIDGGTATGLVAGETYLVVAPEELVRHPRTNEVIGRQFAFRGQIKILCADEHVSRGMVLQTCMPIRIGDRLKPVPQIPIPLARIPKLPGFCDPQSGKTKGVIIRSEGGWQDALGEGHLIEINLGQDDQVTPGDFLTVYRNSPQKGQPPQLLGEIGVLTTEAKTATAKIVEMRYSMMVGDTVEVK
ncbi:MAG: hypothetical protein QOI24_3589 [Acidobacteriota bacterium]|jgi:LysM repeat protein|nr:hypothetical protein [Acidobacteriota bacterium]